MLRDVPEVNALNPRPKCEAGLKAEKSIHAKHAGKAVKFELDRIAVRIIFLTR